MGASVDEKIKNLQNTARVVQKSTLHQNNLCPNKILFWNRLGGKILAFRNKNWTQNTHLEPASLTNANLMLKSLKIDPKTISKCLLGTVKIHLQGDLTRETVLRGFIDPFTSP